MSNSSATPLPSHTDVLVVGAGPCGLSAAISLRLKGIRVAIVDQADVGGNLSRAVIVYAKTLDLLDTIGCAKSLMEREMPASKTTMRDKDTILLEIDFAFLPSPFPCALIIPQTETESVLLARLEELDVNVVRPKKAIGLRELEGGFAEVQFEDGDIVRARYVLGADGLHSNIRQLAGVQFVTLPHLRSKSPAPTEDDPQEYMAQLSLADVHLSSPHPRLPNNELSIFLAEDGLLVWAPLTGDKVRVIAPIPFSETPPKDPSIDYLNNIIGKRGITGPKVDKIFWGGRFRIRSCIAQDFVIPLNTNTEANHGAIILAGDAAHVHSPAGGQGMNLGIRDGILLADAIEADIAWPGPSISES